MGHQEIEKRRNNQQLSRYQSESSIGGTAWKILGGTALALVAAAVIISLPDIKRYIKISTM
ncbi:MAG: hypothetical protein M3R14_12450 [Acidobacteriota bacterium]|nr:hypothetical protein [Acidobacteriota bacterium]